MKRNFDIGLIELAMRVFERTRQAAANRNDFVMAEVVTGVMADFGCSEGTAFRHVRMAVDVLGIHYDADAGRQAKKRRKQQDACYQGQCNARAAGWPNGKPGHPASLDKSSSTRPASHPWRDAA